MTVRGCPSNRPRQVRKGWGCRIRGRGCSNYTGTSMSLFSGTIPGREFMFLLSFRFMSRGTEPESGAPFGPEGGSHDDDNEENAALGFADLPLPDGCRGG